MDFLECIWTAEALRTNPHISESMQKAGARALEQYRARDAEFVDEAIRRMPVPCPVCQYRPYIQHQPGRGHHVAACCVTPDLWGSTELAAAQRWNDAVAAATPEAIQDAIEMEPTRHPRRFQITHSILHGEDRR